MSVPACQHISPINKKSGFSLLEMTIVLCAASIIAYSASLAYSEFSNKTRISMLSYNLSLLREALQDFARDHGYYPYTLSDLLNNSGSYQYLNKIPFDTITGNADWEVKKGSSALIATGGMIVYYPFREGSGSTARDYTGNPNNATLFNNPLWGTGKSDYSLTLNGANQYLYLDNTGTNANPTFDNGLTVRSGNFWYKATNVAGAAYRFLYEEGGIIVVNTNDAGINLYIQNGSLYTGAWSRTDGWNGSWLSAPTTSGTWHMATYVFDAPNSRFKLFHDGLFVTQEVVIPATGIAVHTGNDAIGCVISEDTRVSGGGNLAPGNFFDGSIDEVRFYNRVLTTQEISDLYTGGSFSWISRNLESTFTGEILDIRSSDPGYQNW